MVVVYIIKTEKGKRVNILTFSINISGNFSSIFNKLEYYVISTKTKDGREKIIFIASKVDNDISHLGFMILGTCLGYCLNLREHSNVSYLHCVFVFQ